MGSSFFNRSIIYNFSLFRELQSRSEIIKKQGLVMQALLFVIQSAGKENISSWIPYRGDKPQSQNRL